jgi:acyl carrier protein
MTASETLVDPFNLVAQALRCSRDSLSMESAMYRDHGWDSFGHVSVIAALEEAYGISISNDEVTFLRTLKAIVEFTKNLRGVDQHAG